MHTCHAGRIAAQLGTDTPKNQRQRRRILAALDVPAVAHTNRRTPPLRIRNLIIRLPLRLRAGKSRRQNDFVEMVFMLWELF
jgi:hypothetical protein